jgi:hypothetical protein
MSDLIQTTTSPPPPAAMQLSRNLMWTRANSSAGDDLFRPISDIGLALAIRESAEHAEVLLDQTTIAVCPDIGAAKRFATSLAWEANQGGPFSHKDLIFDLSGPLPERRLIMPNFRPIHVNGAFAWKQTDQKSDDNQSLVTEQRLPDNRRRFEISNADFKFETSNASLVWITIVAHSLGWVPHLSTSRQREVSYFHPETAARLTSCQVSGMEDYGWTRTSADETQTSAKSAMIAGQPHYDLYKLLTVS